MMAENPNASLREVARVAGISPATASDVKKRIQAGRPPATTDRRAGGGAVAPLLEVAVFPRASACQPGSACC